MHIIIDVLMIVVFVMQIIVLSHLLYVNHKRYKQAKEFYEHVKEQENPILNELSLTQQQKIFDLIKENQLSEQRKQDESL